MDVSQWSFSRYNCSEIESDFGTLKPEMIIFVDGWNEANTELAQALNEECHRINSEKLRFVISLTSIAASRLLHLTSAEMSAL